MGIKNLYQMIKEISPKSIKKQQIKDLKNKKIAIDSSVINYEFLTQFNQIRNESLYQLQDKKGNLTGHLMGIFNRSIFLIKNDILPVWVFDGIPPESKQIEVRFKYQLNKRRVSKQYNLDQLNLAKENNELEHQVKFAKRSIFVSDQMRQDSIQIAELMGLPYIIAPQEAEAQCAYLNKIKYVDMVNSQDFDVLPFGKIINQGGTQLIRNLKNDLKKETELIDKNQILADLNMDQNQFIDFCILLGCDFSEKIYKMGLQLIQDQRQVQNLFKNTNRLKILLPTKFDFQIARKQFTNHEVLEPEAIQRKDLDLDKLRHFLIEQKQFGESRIKKRLEDLVQFHKSNNFF